LEAAADAWDVIATETVGFGAVEVATTTLWVVAAGTTVAVEVNSGCAVCAEQKEINGSNSGST
jgi:hypothetical protein